MKVAALTRYSRLGASSRTRFYQYFPPLVQSGVDLVHRPLFGDEYVQALQHGGSKAQAAARSMLLRMQHLRQCSAFDLVWVEKDALPWLPAMFELGLLPGQVPLVLDYDDAVFHQYDLHPRAWVRRWLGDKHQQLMRRADLVVAGNQYIASYAREAGARRVEILPTVVDLSRYTASKHGGDWQSESPVTVGWIGQRSTAGFLNPLKSVFQQLGSEMDVRFKAIGINARELGFPMDSEAWSEGTEVASIQSLDIGIMPLEDGPFERGKCGYKLIQYMACGLPVVASPVGANKSIVEHGVNGFFATTSQEWKSALRTLISDPALRQQMGQAGREKVEREYCLKVTAPRLMQWLAEVAQDHKNQGKAG